MKNLYKNDNVRRQDRLLNETLAVELLRGGEYGILSMVECLGDEVGGYGVPISYVWDSENSIYFHCAPEGHKVNCLKTNSLVSFCIVGQTKIISNKFTTAYESIIIRGVVSLELSSEERMKALMLILDKYSPDCKEAGMKYAENSFNRTNIIKFDIKEFSGKTKRLES